MSTRPPGWAQLLGLWLLTVLVCGASAAQGQPALTARVIHVIDGDTIRVRIGHRHETVRYIGVNAPEIDHPDRAAQPFGREAAAANRRLVKGEIVRLELDVERRDRYGRLLAYVYVGDVMVNAELVARGYAQAMTIPPNVRHQRLLVKLEREARRRQLGLWARGQARDLVNIVSSDQADGVSCRYGGVRLLPRVASAGSTRPAGAIAADRDLDPDLVDEHVGALAAATVFLAVRGPLVTAGAAELDDLHRQCVPRHGSALTAVVSPHPAI